MTAATSLGVAVLAGKLYAVGGYSTNDDGSLGSMERYVPAANAWPWEEARSDGVARIRRGGGGHIMRGKDQTTRCGGSRRETLV